MWYHRRVVLLPMALLVVAATGLYMSGILASTAQPGAQLKAANRRVAVGSAPPRNTAAIVKQSAESEPAPAEAEGVESDRLQSSAGTAEPRDVPRLRQPTRSDETAPPPRESDTPEAAEPAPKEARGGAQEHMEKDENQVFMECGQVHGKGRLAAGGMA